MSGTHHEHLDAGAGVALSSDRTFGLVFSAFLTLAALLPLLHRRPVRWPVLGAALVCLLIAVSAPRLLHPLNWAWAQLAMLLHRIVSPVAMALVFFTAFTVTGALLRMFGKDLLRLRPAPESDTYWIRRDPAPPPRETMLHQF